MKFIELIQIFKLKQQQKSQQIIETDSENCTEILKERERNTKNSSGWRTIQVCGKWSKN